jgi:CHAT domain-containing protein
MPVQLNSPWWQIRRASRSGTRSPVGAQLADLPAEFLSAESHVVEQAVLEPAAAVRGDGAGGAIDITGEIEPGYTAVLAVRHPSGALTFSLPIATTSRDVRSQSQVRFQVPATRGTTRGVVGQAVKAIVIKVAKVAGDKAASFVLPRLAEALEHDVWKRRGLQEGWQGVSKETLASGRLESRAPVSPARSLLLLHGTFSNAASTFRPLADLDFFARVEETYNDRIYAFDCFSISRTPEQNARRLLESLPGDETTFDVVTHGLGGLVLRNIVERGDLFGSLSRRFKLGHAVLVASPNLGTPLASSERWENTLGWIANVVEMFPDNPFTTGSAFVANGLVWLANHALGDLPGLRALDPHDDSIDAIQRQPGPPSSAYSALVANYHPGGGIVQRLVDIGIDQFFGGANDLVVPTEGGWRIDRSSRSHVPATRIGCFGKGGNLPADSVTHVNYFSQPATADFIVRALLGHQQPLRVVEPGKLLPDRRVVRGATDAPAARPAAQTARAVELTDAEVEQTVERPPLKITIVNGDLTFEREVLMIGHYHATRLTGTEEVMDRIIGGKMARSLAMGVYPVAIGSHKFFINNRPNLERGVFLPRPKAVIVVGLGEEGNLRAADLAQSVRQAVIAWSQGLGENRERPPRTFELAATLLGSGGTGISASEAARLIAEGVHQANELLADQNRESFVSPLVDHLRFIELHLDRATDAWRALRLQGDATPGRYELTDEVKSGSGGLTRPQDLGYRGVRYDFITIEATKDGDGTPLISFKLDTRRARAEVSGQRAQSRLIGELVATGSNDKNNDEDIGRTLFDLLIPVEIEAYLTGSSEMQLELDPQTASIPWELLHSRRDSRNDEPWAIRVKLLRKLRIKDFRQQVTDTGAGDKVLVIGEPECPPGFLRLYGARAEAQAVYDCLRGENGLGDEEVTSLFSDDAEQLGSNATDIINALFKEPWRIVHITGHGMPGKNGKPGGVVLSNGTFLGPAEVDNMRSVPELVFLNCCHLGAADAGQLLNARYDRATFASGVAGALVSNGVRCVIAAGWAVDDEGARVFAEAFYGALLRGDRFIDAVSAARRQAYLHNPDQNTWAAYQCYGDPYWVFRQAKADPNRASTASVDYSAIASALGLKFELERIYVETRFQGYSMSGQLEKLKQLEASHARKWGAKGDVAELFGAAFTEAGDIESGLRWYESSVAAKDGRASLKAAEQLANVRGRLAWESVDRAMRHLNAMKEREASKGQSPKARGEARRARLDAERALAGAIDRAEGLIRDSIALLEKLSAIEQTTERASLVGSAYKRRALVNLAAGKPSQVDRDLELMSKSYAQAQSLAERAGASDVFYPAANCLVAEVALNAGKGRWRSLDAPRVKIIEESLASGEQDFWTVVGDTELKLYNALAKRRLASLGAKLEKAYADLHRRVSSTRMWGSVYDTACLTLPMYAGRATARERKAAQALLAQLRTFAHPTGA